MTQKSLPELAIVRLTGDWFATVTLPKGFTGTIVHVHPQGGYDVEFTDGEGRGFVIGVPSDYVEKVQP